MNIHQALKQVTPEKERYFRYKFQDLRYDQSRPDWTEESFLKQVDRRTMNSFYEWEKTEEYKNLLQLYLNTKIADDFKEIYDIVSENAKKGDEKSIKLFINLQKEIQSNAKIAGKLFESNAKEDKKEDNDENDGLDLT